MGKPEHRRAADRRGLRYPSDLIDAEWVLIAPLVRPGRRGGCKRSVDVREVLNAIFYVLAPGCQWNALPKDLPPKSTAHFERGLPLDPKGFDAGKKVTGSKRHILVDTLGLSLGVSFLPANIQDRDGARD